MDCFTRVEDSELRLKYLPAVFDGQLMKAMEFEGAVYHFAKKFVPSYNGGLWEFYEPQGCRAPIMIGFGDNTDAEAKIRVVNELNYTDQEMTPRAASIGIVLIVLSNLSFQPNGEIFGERFQELYDFIFSDANEECVEAFLGGKDEVRKLVSFID